MGATTTQGTGHGSAETPIRGVGPVHKILQNNELRAAFDERGQKVIQRLEAVSFATTTISSSSYDAGDSNETVIFANAASNPITVNLPPAADSTDPLRYDDKKKQTAGIYLNNPHSFINKT